MNAMRWFRNQAPGAKTLGYGFAVDMWAQGITVAEMMLGEPLLMGDDDRQQLALIEEVHSSNAPPGNQANLDS